VELRSVGGGRSGEGMRNEGGETRREGEKRVECMVREPFAESEPNRLWGRGVHSSHVQHTQLTLAPMHITGEIRGHYI